MAIEVKRAYEPPSRSDGKRLLVDRVWPRGLAKDKAELTLWLKDLAPSTELRKWFGHDPERWDEFRRRYGKELDGNADMVSELAELAAKAKVTLLYGARDEKHNNAVALAEYLRRKG